MAVRWPDGDYTGSVRVDDVEPTPVVEPEPEEIKQALVIESPTTKEVKDGSR